MIKWKVDHVVCGLYVDSMCHIFIYVCLADCPPEIKFDFFNNTYGSSDIDRQCECELY